MPRKPKPAVGDADSTAGGNYREIGARRCWVDGVPVDRGGIQEGWCSEARAYAVAYLVRVVFVDEHGRERKLDMARRTDCPFTCPLCRAPLTWDGGCDACRGSRIPSDRTTWTFPGDRHEDFEAATILPAGERASIPGVRYVTTGHYRLAARGPRPVATETETLAGFAEIKRALATLETRALQVSPDEVALAADPEEPAWVREEA